MSCEFAGGGPFGASGASGVKGRGCSCGRSHAAPDLTDASLGA